MAVEGEYAIPYCVKCGAPQKKKKPRYRCGLDILCDGCFKTLPFKIRTKIDHARRVEKVMKTQEDRGNFYNESYYQHYAKDKVLAWALLFDHIGMHRHPAGLGLFMVETFNDRSPEFILRDS